MNPPVVPTEDVVHALLDYLVEPLLSAPVNNPSTADLSPTSSQQEAMAKQMHGVVLLYNYYHRKQFQHLEFLDFESFCKMSANAKPRLLVYMGLMQRCSSKSNEKEKPLSPTEKAIMEACNISLALDASRDIPCMEGWPISKVVVFLIDKMKKNCLVQFGSICQGVWSPLEKDIDNSNDEHSVTMNFDQLAYSVVKEETDIDQKHLMILESHIVPSLTAEKTAARFYLLRSTKTIRKDVIPIPIGEIMDSLQGPLVNSYGVLGNTISGAVENFHLLPYAGILSDWVSRTGQENETMESSPTKDHSDTIDDESRDRTGTVNQEINLDCITRGSYDVVHPSTKGKSMPTQNKVSVNPVDRKRKSSIKGDPSFTKTDRKQKVGKVDKVDLVTEPGNNGRLGAKAASGNYNSNIQEPSNNGHSGVKAAYGNDNGNIGEPFNNGCSGAKPTYRNDSVNIVLPVEEVIPSADHPVLSQSNSENPDKIHDILSSKGSALLNAAVRALHKKRDELSQQQRNLQDDIVLCEQNLQKVLSGGDDLMLKLECIIEACNTECYARCTRPHMDTHQNSEERNMPHMKMNNLSEAILCIRNPCQDLDEICCKNNWALPRYNILPSNGGFHAKVTLKGLDFELSVGGEPHADPREARESAAANMLTKLRSTANQSNAN